MKSIENDREKSNIVGNGKVSMDYVKRQFDKILELVIAKVKSRKKITAR